MSDTTPEPEESPETATETDDGMLVDSPVPQLARRYIWWVAFAALILVALVAGANFYRGATATIDVWVSERYRPLFQSVFNLTVLLVAGIGLVWLVRNTER